jgi:polyvinyl alcohol dehydrogenase (cytochrome)
VNNTSSRIHSLAASAAGPLLLLLALLIASTPALAQVAATSSSDLERIFEIRCATCHGAESEHAPARSSLEARTPDAIVAALTTGSMRPMATGLSSEEIAALAHHISRLGTVAVDGPIDPQQGFCASTPPLRPISPNDWNGWSRDVASTRFQPEPGFTVRDVPQLRVKWAFALDGEIHSQPTVAAGRVFVSSIPGRLFSLDADSGCIVWSYESAPGQGGEWGGAGSRSTVVVGEAGNRLAAFFGDDAAHVQAVDVETGQAIWRTRVDEHPVARVTGSVVLHEGLVYVPLSSLEEGWAGSDEYGCCTFRGSVAALDAATGRIVWKTYTVPEEAKPYRLNSAGVQQFGPAGAPIWSTPTVDPARGVVYAATGNSYTDIENPGSNAIFAFDLRTGEVRWLRQVREADNYIVGCPNAANCPEDDGPDFDFGSSPIVRVLPDGSSVLIVADKGGEVYGLDPDTGGRTLWSTKVGEGSALGGVQWGSAADDSLVYVAVSDYIAHPQRRKPGLTALRIADGEVVWHAPAPPPFCSWSAFRCTDGHSAAVTLMPGAVFSGSLDGHMRAFSAATGSVIWDFDTARLYRTVNGQIAEGGSLDAGGAVIANGTVFLTSGYSRFGRKPGNVLIALTPGGR